MADIIETQNAAQTQEVKLPEGVSPEHHLQMQVALTGKMPEVTASTDENNTQQSGNNTQQPELTPFSFDIFKNEFQYEKPEQIVEDIRNYRTLKNTPPPVAEIKFEGDNAADVKVLYEAFTKGDIKSVYNYLNEQMRIDGLTTQDVTEQNAPDILKTQMALKYKELTPAEIDRKFNKSYSFPAAPKEDKFDTPEDYLEAKKEWENTVEGMKIDMVMDAKIAKPELLAHKKNLVLPTIEQPQTQANPNFDNFQKEWELLDKEFAATQTAVKTFTPNQFEIKMPFSDKENDISFEFQFIPDQESFSKTAESVLEDPLRSTAYRNQDGTIDSKASYRDQYILQNFEKIIVAAMNQSKTATIKAMLPDNTNQGMNRIAITPEGEKTEVQKQMDIALGRYMPQNGQRQIVHN